MSSEEDAAA